MSKKLLTYNLAQPLDGVARVNLNINPNYSNLIMDGANKNALLLASGSLEYFEGNSPPDGSIQRTNAHSTLTITSKEKARGGFRLPWSACNGATSWLVHLNPLVQYQISVEAGGGNVKLDLKDLVINEIAVENGGGNIEVHLPEVEGNLSVMARTGAGNVDLQLPTGMAVRLHATSGLGKVLVSPRFVRIDSIAYQTADFETAASKIEINAKSGAGNVCILER